MKLAFKFIAGSRNKKVLLLILAAAVVLTDVSTAFAQAGDNQSDPGKLFNLGQDAHEKGDFQTAVKFYDEALKANPEFPEAEYQKGAALVSLGKSDEAE